MDLIADAGPGPLIYPIVGCLAIAGLLIATSVIVIGVYIVKSRKKKQIQSDTFTDTPLDESVD